MSLSADGFAACLLLPLAVWTLLSGLDDLLIDAVGLLAWWRSRHQPQPGRRELLTRAQQRIAIFVPCWQESDVLGRMIAGNRRRLIYDNYHFFIGAYPNDEPTVAAGQDLAARFPNVHLALCPHAGPTSKADCLNWIYQRMGQFERSEDVRFDLIVTHDAEDVIHADSLLWLNWHAADYDMIQVPVLPLPTPAWELTHGVYCDEFSEYQCRDMPARQFMSAFVPSNGVGTGFRRDALESLAHAEDNRIFEPVCLTEDYENGLRLRLRQARQHFLRIRGLDVTTREYFPRSLRAAVRQRTRWVTGIALQTWERHGWEGSWADRYWLWRDRKGLLGNPASLLANAVFLYGVAAAGAEFRERLAELAPLLLATAGIGLYRAAFRCWAVGRRYGPGIAAIVPARVVLGNIINTAATVRALGIYLRARLAGRPLRWVKTEHQYPSAAALETPPQFLGEILTANGYTTAAQIAEALSSRPAGQRLGERLVEMGCLRVEDLYDALSVQAGLPRASVASQQVAVGVARSLPRRIVDELRVMPFRVEDGKLLLATPGIPGKGIAQIVGQFTRLEVRFCLVLPGDYDALVQQLL